MSTKEQREVTAYCKNCGKEMPSTHVTFEERCALCGDHIEWFDQYGYDPDFAPATSFKQVLIEVDGEIRGTWDRIVLNDFYNKMFGYHNKNGDLEFVLSLNHRVRLINKVNDLCLLDNIGEHNYGQ